MTGFTYNGIHCSAFGLYYIPSKEDLWFSDPEYEVYDTDVEWKHGGYYFASKANVRTFKIKCYFEEIDIKKRQAIKRWLRFDTFGTLVFDDLPFVYWNVRPAKVPAGGWYNDTDETHSGTLDIEFNAYEPFGYMSRKSNTGQEDDNAEDYCNIISSSDMPSAPTTSSTSFDVYNPGTEECGLSIELAGSTSNPFRFFNEANGSFCEFGSIPSNSLRLAIDGDTGYVSTYTAGSSTSECGFSYHNKGVVCLAPNYGASSVAYTYQGLSGTLHVFDISGYTVTNDLMGGKLVADSKTFTIDSVSTANNRLFCTYDGTVTVQSSGTCSFQTLNHIVIEEKIDSVWTATSTLDLSYIAIDYKPRIM